VRPAGRTKKNGVARDAVTPILATVWLQFWADVSGCYRGNIDLWLPDQGFYEDCQVLLSQLSEWPSKGWSAGRGFPNSLLCAKGYPFHWARERRFSRPREHPTHFHIHRSNVFLVTASLPGTTVGPFQRIERNARYAFYPCWHIGMPSTSCYARALRVVRTVAFSRRPNLEIGVRVHPALVRAPCLGVRRLALRSSLIKQFAS
jgi:hypothetical protein